MPALSLLAASGYLAWLAARQHRELQQVHGAVSRLGASLEESRSATSAEQQRAAAAENEASNIIERLAAQEKQSSDRIDELGRAMMAASEEARSQLEQERERSRDIAIELERVHGQFEQLAKKVRSSEHRRRSAEVALAAFTESAAGLSDISGAEYDAWLRAQGFMGHEGPIIEYRPIAVETGARKDLPPVLLVRLPLMIENLAEELPQLVRQAIRMGSKLAEPNKPAPGNAINVEWCPDDNAVRVKNPAHLGALLYAIPEYGPTLLIWTVDLRKKCSTRCQSANHFSGCECSCGGVYHGRGNETPWPGWTHLGSRRSYLNDKEERVSRLESKWWKGRTWTLDSRTSSE